MDIEAGLLGHVVGQQQGLNEGPGAVALEALRQQLFEAKHLMEEATVGIALVHETHKLHGAALHDLVQHQALIEEAGRLRAVRLETT